MTTSDRDRKPQARVPTATSGAVSVADLLDRAALAGATVLAGSAGLSRAVTAVSLLHPEALGSAALAPGAIILLTTPPAAARWEHLVDLLVRRAHAHGCPAVVVPAILGGLSAAPIRLADRLGVTIICRTADLADLDVAVALRAYVRDAEAEAFAALLPLARVSSASARSLDQVVAALTAATGGAAAVLSARRGVVAGRIPDDLARRVVGSGTIDWSDPPLVLTHSPGTDPAGLGASAAAQDGPPGPGVPGVRRTWVVLPLATQGDHPQAWMLLGRGDPGPRWVELAGRALGMVRGDVMAWLAVEQVETEREAGRRAWLFNEIVEQRDAVSADVQRQAQQLGWTLTGWHTAVYLHVEGAGEAVREARSGPQRAVGEPGRIGTAVVEAIIARLAARGLVAGPAVQRIDGWVAWFTTPGPPSPATLRVAVRLVREELVALTGRLPGTRVALGVGSARRDASGIAHTVAEAREAALIAAGGSGGVTGVTVRVVADLGASRLLLGWYGSGAFADLSRQVLGPLADLDEPELLDTLEAYLERACSAAHTARALGVHRNTVGQRIARVEKLLGVSLSQPDTRLALQLALRAHRRRD